MPTNRKRLARRPAIHSLYDSMRLYLETGDMKKTLDTCPLCLGLYETFRLGYTSHGTNEELKKIWLQHRDMIMSDWKKSKKPGLPWAEINL